MAKVLITGATGFVGKRLIITLLEMGHEVYALCRIDGTQAFAEDHPRYHNLVGDLRNPQLTFPEDLDAAYYLVHSMSEIVSDLAEAEMEVANSFVSKIKNTQAKQIIYLGGIINSEEALSPHLKSRLLVESILRGSGIPLTILRASIIIGAGSASFEIIRDLAEKLPIMIAPKWVDSPSQPIAIQDVLYYLSHVLLDERTYNKIFDIGGDEIFTFKELLLGYAEFRNLKRYIINVPVLTPRLSSYWLIFITSVKFSLCFYLAESIKGSSIIKLKGIDSLYGHECLTYHKSLELAFQSIAQNEVISTWMDSWELEGLDPSISKYIEVPTEGCLIDERTLEIVDSKEEAIDRIWLVGSDMSAYSMGWAWKLRGLIDKFLGGGGLYRGRKGSIRVGEATDFWRVLKADKVAGDLILYAEMKLPGEAWFEYHVTEENQQWFVHQKATFRPKGVLGRLYWYMLVPFHAIIFGRMAQALAGKR